MQISNPIINLTQQATTRDKSEIGLLSTTFNTMTAQLRQVMVDLEQNQARFRNIIDSIPLDMYIYQLTDDGQLLFNGANPNAKHLAENYNDEWIGKPIQKFFPTLGDTELPARYREIAAEGQSWQTERVLQKAGQSPSKYEVYAFQTSPGNMVSAYLDISDRKQMAAEHERLQQKVIKAHQQAIRELSSPVIPLMDTSQGCIIVMPLIGNIDTMRARGITRTLLSGISQYNARVVILDITGVPIVDSGVANYLNKTIQAAQLEGAHTIITGTFEAMAETIVNLGIDWTRIQTSRFANWPGGRAQPLGRQAIRNVSAQPVLLPRNTTCITRRFLALLKFAVKRAHPKRPDAITKYVVNCYDF